LPHILKKIIFQILASLASTILKFVNFLYRSAHNIRSVPFYSTFLHKLKAIVSVCFIYSVACLLVMMTPDDPPNANPVLDSNGIVKYGPSALSHILTDRWSPYHDIVGIIYEADDFYEVSHNIVMWCWKHASMGDVTTMDELQDYLLVVEEYSLPDTSKQRKPHGSGMKAYR
jgi:hypothetical protein